jgi:S-adenosylmethionine synthetase
MLPDGKSQVTLEYEDNKQVRASNIVISAQHAEKVTEAELSEWIRRVIIPETFFGYDNYIDDKTVIQINPTGRFVVGGFEADTGLTGRKLIADNWGCVGHIGGGAFSGKDPTKVDRSGAYAARQAAKAVVDSGIAHHCEVALAYAIGQAEPVMINIKSDALISDDDVKKIILRSVDFTPSGIITRLDLRRPIYAQTARNGHFGIQTYTWEQTDGLLKRES